MIVQMFRLITLFGCIFLGSTHTSVSKSGEEKDPWSSRQTTTVAASPAGHVLPSSDVFNTTQHTLKSTLPPTTSHWATTTNPTYTGLEKPPILNNRLYTTSSSLQKQESSSTLPLALSSSPSTRIELQSNKIQQTDDDSWTSTISSGLPSRINQKVFDKKHSSLLYPVRPYSSTVAPPVWRRRSYQGTHSSSSRLLQQPLNTSNLSPSPNQNNSEGNSFSRQVSTAYYISTAVTPGSSHPTVKQWKAKSTFHLGTPPSKTTPLPPLTDQDEYYSAYPDYSEPLPQTNSSEKVEGVLVPEPEGVSGKLNLERKNQLKTQHFSNEFSLKDKSLINRHRFQDRQDLLTWGDNPPINRREFASQGSSAAALEKSILNPLDQVRTDDRRLTLELPDDSLADTDLHDHDLIDSVMYIYFGASPADQRAPGRQVVVVGCVVGLLAQFLTLAGGVRRMRTKPDSSLYVLLNTELALTLTNLLFILGVQARGAHCEAVAVSLHYLHLVVCSWLSASCLHSYRRIVHPTRSNPLTIYAAVSWGLPAIPTLLCYWLEREAYETRDYCWMSVERGMMLSFLLPTSLLILVNTILALAGLKQAKQDDPERRSLRISASLLPMFSVIWFLGVVALEHSSSLVLPLLFVATSGFLNWFVLICWLPSEAGGWKATDEDLEDEEDDLYEQEVKVVMDEQPLLQEVCLSRPPYHTLHMEPISMISS